ncbi:MAG TPA: hypothetical protein VF764_11255, partial [Steroidobacteraceae bacterium]
MSGFSRLWQFDFLGNELGQWAVALVIFLVTFTVLPVIKRVISRQRRREAPTPQGYVALDLLADVIAHTNWLFLLGVAVWLAARDLNFPDRIDRGLNIVLVLLLWMQLALWAMAAIRYGLDLRRR